MKRKHLLFFCLLIFSFSFLKANNLPVDIGSDTTLCEGQSLLLVVPLVGDSINYLWSTGDTTQTIMVDTSAIYSVIVSSPNCIGFDTIDVNFILGPDLSISANDVCFGDPTQFVINSTHDSSASYIWNFGDGQFSSLMVDTLFHEYGMNGQSYSASLTIVNGNGCIASDTILVESLLNPSAKFTIDSVCFNLTSSIFNTSESVANGAIVTIHYGNGDSLITINEPNYPVLYGSPQSYNVVIEIDNNNGCTDTQTISTIVYPLPQTSFSGLDSIYCQGTEIDTLIGFPSGGVFTGINVENNTGTADSIGYFTPLQSGENILITYTFIDSNGCFGISEKEISKVYEYTEISFLVEDSLYCIGNSSDTLTVNFLGGNFTGNFLTLDPTLPSNMAVFTPTEIGMFPIGYDAIDTNGCNTSATQNLIVGGVVYKELPNDTSIISGESLVLSLGQENPDYSYLWSNGATAPFIEIQNPGFYIVNITDLITGCWESDTVFVNLSTGIDQLNHLIDLKIFPNPVSDELNVSFISEVGQETKISLFNSTGQMVFEKKIDLVGNQLYHYSILLFDLPVGMYVVTIGGLVLPNAIVKME